MINMILTRLDKTREIQIAVWKNPEPYTLTKAERAAARINKKAVEAAPLLAFGGLVDEVEPEDLKEKRTASHEAYCQRMIDGINKNYEQIKDLIYSLPGLFTESELIKFEAYRVKTYPQDLAYDLLFWKKVIGAKHG